MDRIGIEALKRAIKIKGSQRAFGKAIGVAQQTVSDVVRFAEKVPAEWILQIEDETEGQVSREDLRPDLFFAPRKRVARRRDVRAMA